MKTTHAELVTDLVTATPRQSVKLAPASYFTGFGIRRYTIEDSQKVSALKERVAGELAREFSCLNRQLIHQVVNEADSLAATTAFPTLLLPVLAEEKARAASLWAARQQMIREQTQTMVLTA